MKNKFFSIQSDYAEVKVNPNGFSIGASRNTERRSDYVPLHRHCNETRSTEKENRSFAYRRNTKSGGFA